MVKRTQIIRRQKPTDCLSAFEHFVGSILKGLKVIQLFVSMETSLSISLCIMYESNEFFYML